MTDAIKKAGQDQNSDQPDQDEWEGGFLLEMARQALEAGDIDGTVRYYQSARKLIPLDTQMRDGLEQLGKTIKDHINGNGKHSEGSKNKNEVRVKNSSTQSNQRTTTPTERSEPTHNQKTHQPLKSITLEEIKQKDRKTQRQIGRIRGIFQKHFYTVPEFQRSVHGTDLIAFRTLKVSEHKHILLIIPIKVSSTLNNALIITESMIKLLKNSTESARKQVETIQEQVNSLSNTPLRIIENLSKKQELFKVACHYLGGTYLLEVNKNRRSVYFHDGMTEYKAVITPLFITRDRIGFAEKVLAYPYQRANNIHYLNPSQLPKFLSFLERKEINTVKYTELDSTIENKANLYNEFLTQIQYTSLIFLPIAIILMILSLIYMSQFFVPFVGLEITSLVGYGLILGYFYMKYLRETQALQKSSDPIAARSSNGQIDETDLELMSTEFTAEEMNQLLYELFGKEHMLDTSRFSSSFSSSEVREEKVVESKQSRGNGKTKPNEEVNTKEDKEDLIVKKYAQLLND